MKNLDEVKMRVYVVECDTGYDSVDTFGIFSTKEKARERINKFSKMESRYMTIEEYVIDEEL